MLERQQRLLHADGGQLDEMRDAGLPGCGQQIHVRLMIYGPGVMGRAGPRGHAGDNGVKALACEPVPRQRRDVLHVHHADISAGEEGWGGVRRCGGRKALEAGDRVSAIRQNAQSRPSDGAGGPR